MATTTTNLGLVLPVGTENVSRQIINDNNSIIDSAIGEVPSGKSLQDEIDDIEEALGDMIDDTAGDGDTDKVWSADKVTDELELKASKASPVFTGSVSMGRKSGATTGTGSIAIGNNVEASGNYSSAFGSYSKASGVASHAEGNATASGDASHAEGYGTASAYNSHAEGTGTASGGSAHAEGGSRATGNCSHAEGWSTEASASYAHSEGNYTVANHRSQHVFGEYNNPDSSEDTGRGTYAEIVGNGTGTNARSNARTLDWSGNERLAGSLTLGMGTANETTITAAQLAQLLALLN